MIVADVIKFACEQELSDCVRVSQNYFISWMENENPNE